ncbi:MAG: sugar phosphate isomerase/epimerase family protein [Planctomycetaceae bacterium]
MSRISISEMTTYRWSFEEDVTGYRAAQVGGVGLWRRKLADFGEERAAELLHESGLAASSLSCAGGFTGSDGHTFRDAVGDALDALRVAAELRAGCLVVVTGARAGHTLNHARRLAVEALKALGEEGARLGVDVALQFARTSQAERWSFVSSLADALDLLEKCGNPQVGLACDLFSVGAEPGPGEIAADLAPRLKLAQLCDANFAALAAGEADSLARCKNLGAVVHRLEQQGYRGWYEVQILCDACWQADYLRLLAGYCSGLVHACPEVFGPAAAASLPHAAPLA